MAVQEGLGADGCEAQQEEEGKGILEMAGAKAQGPG